MTAGRFGAVLAFLMASGAPLAAAQDTSVTRHLLWLDLSRLHPFERTYDVVMHRGDSATIVGDRRLSLEWTRYAGQEAWLLVDSRTGVVPAVDSLYLSPDFRPLHWASSVGPARLAMEFAGDSLLGAVTAARSKQNVRVVLRPDLAVTGSMAEALLGLVPLDAGWSDSVAVLVVTAATTRLVPGELVVVGTEAGADGDIRAWTVALRVARATNAYTIERETGVPVRVVQQVPAHVGTMLELRLRHDPPAG